MDYQNCSKHGTTYVQFKCKFCCSTAVWFSNGTHFCESCYKIKDNIIKLPQSKLQICEWPGKCAIGGIHGGNGI